MTHKINPYNHNISKIVKIKVFLFNENISEILSKPFNNILNINEVIKGININPKRKNILFQHSK